MTNTHFTLLFSIGLLTSTQLFAAPSDALIEQYNMAAQGDSEQVETVYAELSQQISTDGSDALSLVYLGSTQTLMGRDAFMPWNKMKYTEQGLATISKGLDLLPTLSTPLDQQSVRQGLPESLLARSLAAATFTSLPDMFNHFERGYDLFVDLLSEQKFQQQNIDAIGWVYVYAIHAALRAEDLTQARAWVEQLTSKAPNHPIVAEAKALIKAA